MRTTVVIPDGLMEEAMAELNIKNKSTLVVMGLKELINQNKIRKLRKFRGKLNLQINLSELRQRGENE